MHRNATGATDDDPSSSAWVSHRLRHVPLNTLAPAPTPSIAHTFSDVSAKLMMSSGVSGDGDVSGNADRIVVILIWV